MTVVDENLLNHFRGAGRCEWCRKLCRSLEPHHLFARGMGGGGRLDVRENLAALCRHCHQSSHDGNRPMRIDLLAIVAARENCLQSDIEETIWRLRRAPKAKPA